ncbi:MAG: CTP synthase [Candidatus Latescibacterota bacterium]|nr:MAG: CTP synthase [Candidatus Latescibacterota bacterium]
MTKYIFVTGGVVSSLGKGIATASLGLLLKRRGLRVTLQKFDPYLNVDPGTMSPFQHGEVFVTDDGTETDLDLGHYERFTDVSLGRRHNTTAGQIYESLIQKERHGDFLGHTVQVVPHVTDAIKERIEAAADGHDVVVTEIGGTVGDIESLPFLEAVRQFRLDVGVQNCMDVHLTLVPYIKAAKEVKTKPTQHSVATLRSIGLQPDALLCRTEMALSESVLRKIGLYCNVETRAVIALPDVQSIYDVPLLLSEQKLDEIVLEHLHLQAEPLQIDSWRQMVQRLHAASEEVEIAVCGKYVQLQDAYKSIIEALTHAGVDRNVRVRIRWVNSEDVESRGAAALLRGVDGVLVPGGFGERGIEGKIAAIRWARENRVPMFGICLGLQCAVIEFARNVLDLSAANSSEFDDKTTDPVIDLMPEQEGVDKGGTMRLGAYPCVLRPGSIAASSYDSDEVQERHRHRWEVSPAYFERLEADGMHLTGRSPDGRLIEIVEVPDHPFFLAVQFHPELRSRPERPHPLFRRFVAASHAFRAASSRRDGTRERHGLGAT